LISKNLNNNKKCFWTFSHLIWKRGLESIIPTKGCWFYRNFNLKRFSNLLLNLKYSFPSVGKKRLQIFKFFIWNMYRYSMKLIKEFKSQFFLYVELFGQHCQIYRNLLQVQKHLKNFWEKIKTLLSKILFFGQGPTLRKFSIFQFFFKYLPCKILYQYFFTKIPILGSFSRYFWALKLLDG